MVKSLLESEGEAMLRVNDEELVHRVFRALELCRYVYYIQEYIPHNNWDIGALVVGGEVVAAMVRRGTGWKINIA